VCGEYKGKIITIEGPDAAGKKTQTKFLIEDLRRLGYSVETMSFPRYDTPTGMKVRAYLNGEYGSLSEVDPKFALRLYAEDRLAALPTFSKWLHEGKIVVFDRYIESNLGHQGAKFSDPGERKKMIEYIIDLECGEMGLPPSDLVLYLSLPLDYMLSAMTSDERRKDVKDIHEGDKGHLIAAKETYDMLAKGKNWVTIDCAPVHGTERYSINQIHEKVMATVESFLARNRLLQKG
jgi:dTMP kinase